MIRMIVIGTAALCTMCVAPTLAAAQTTKGGGVSTMPGNHGTPGSTSPGAEGTQSGTMPGNAMPGNQSMPNQSMPNQSMPATPTSGSMAPSAPDTGTKTYPPCTAQLQDSCTNTRHPHRPHH